MSSKIVPVPNIIGMEIEKAKAKLRQLNLKLIISENRQFDDTIAKDLILLQSPAAGTKTKANSAIKAVLSNGTKTFTVPDLIGLSIRRAQIVLSSNGFNLGQVALVHSDKEKDTVLSQEPPPTMEVMRSSRVSLLVSLGPRPQDYIMPDLSGKSFSQVLPFLKNNGFRIGNVRKKHFPDSRPGIIIQQYPQAGFRVNKDTIIHLWISQG